MNRGYQLTEKELCDIKAYLKEIKYSQGRVKELLAQRGFIRDAQIINDSILAYVKWIEEVLEVKV